MRCGLLGKSLKHSYSPQIHAHFGTYPYVLFEKKEEEVAAFLRERPFDGINVTIPYKKTVVPFLDALSPMAERLGSVNTIIKRADGTLFGHNTDYYGFSYMLHRSSLCPKGKKALVLGSGGAAVTARAVLLDRGAEVIVISRTGPENYGNIGRHYDASLIVNTTPLGMYPENGAVPLSLAPFSACEGVLELIYNPSKTALLLEAERLGIPHENGLSMLVAQGKESAEHFTGKPLSDALIEKTISSLTREQKNIVLIGMPGAGKSTLGKKLAERTGRTFVDSDEEIALLAGKPVPEIIEEKGEAAFREMETAVLGELGKRSGLVLATGGGCVTRAENYSLLHQNGTIFWLLRDIAALPTEGRPLSSGGRLAALYQERRPLYERFADIQVENQFETIDMTERVLSLYENFSD